MSAEPSPADLVPVGPPPFVLALPPGARDASTYTYVLPSARRYSASVVVKLDDLPEAAGDEDPLLRYAREQVTSLTRELAGFEELEPLRALEAEEGGRDGRLRLRYRWGESPSRFVQEVLFVADRPRGLALVATLTHLADASEAELAAARAALAGFGPREDASA